MLRVLAVAGTLALVTGCTTPVAHRTEATPLTAARADDQPLPRHLIRRGRMDVKVDEVEAARRSLERAAAALGGQVERYVAEAAERADYVIRVPPDNLEPLMDSAAALGKVGSRTVSAEDVTASIVDDEGRLAGLRASRDRLQQLMERATTVSDVVAVERELARVQGEIEVLEKRIAFLRSQVAMSELTVRLERRLVPGPLTQVVLGLGAVLKKLFVWR